jgi:hypothetical protein
MPSSVVRTAEQERLWSKAKALAEKQGHAGDYAYIMGIFKQMGGLGKADMAKAGHWSGIGPARWPGQIPGREEAELMRLATRKPTYPSEQAYMESGQEILTPDAITADLGIDPATAADFQDLVERETSIAGVRTLVRGFSISHDLESAQSMMLLRRSLKYKEAMNKSEILYIDLNEQDKLEKAEARGGKYYRRIPKPGGGYRYVYSEEDYHKNKDAHVSGEDAVKKYVSSSIARCIDKAGGTCGVDAFKALVEKHGSKTIANSLRDSVKQGTLTYKKGKFKKAEEKANDKKRGDAR